MAQARIWLKATEGWFFSGLKLDPKDHVVITATGKWTANPATGEVDANGNTGLSTNNRTNYSYFGPDGKEGQLIARVGTDKPFICGTQNQFSGKSGDLVFVINDDLTAASGDGLADNDGFQIVTIDINP
jgi:hypothetical protein